MKMSRQALLVVVLLVVVAGGWLAYERWSSSNQPAAAGAGQGAGATAQSGGGAGTRPGAGGSGFNRSGQGGGAGFSGGFAAPVITAKVATADDGLEVDAVGTVDSARSITIYPQVTGIVASVAFTQGTGVKQGQTLVTLVDDDKQVAVEQAQLALDTANQTYDRTKTLAASNNATTVALTDAETAVRKAEIDLKAAQIDLAKSTIAAPFAGIVGLTDVSVGDLVTTQKAITTLDDMSTMTVSFVVPERASGVVAVGQAVTATTAAIPGKTFTGKITAVDSHADPVARTLAVEATLPNDTNDLKPGMAMNVVMTFPGQQRTVVPSLAVQWDKNGAYVWKIVDATAHRATVAIIGRRSGEVLVASKDVTTGDDVVVEGLQRLREGAQVTPAGGPPAAANASTGSGS